jgi:O-methyltransferase domain/Dimerisation domain
LDTNHTDSTSPFERMFEMVYNFWVTRAVYAAVRLAIPDQLASGPKTPAELAELVQAHPRSLYRLLRALASIGIFEECEQGRFRSTALSDTLRSDVPGSLASLVLLELGDSHHRAWGELVHSLRSGEPAFDKAMGTKIWQFFADNPEPALTLDRAMTGLTMLVVSDILNIYDFTPFNKIVDVGGGAGGFLDAILATQPEATGILFDLPYVIENTRAKIVETVADKRYELVGGSFFDQIPSGGDLYLLKWVLHDWSDDASIMILKNCRAAIAENGTLLIVDTVLPPGNLPAAGKFIDLNMMVLSGGQERSAEEFDILLTAAGFRLNRVLPTKSSSSVVEAVPVEALTHT